MGPHDMKCTVQISGCHDTTRFTFEVSPAELDFLRRLSDLSSEHSEDGCQPTMWFEAEETDPVSEYWQGLRDDWQARVV